MFFDEFFKCDYNNSFKFFCVGGFHHMYFLSEIERFCSVTKQPFDMNYLSCVDRFSFELFDIEYFGVNVFRSCIVSKLYLKSSDYFRKCGADDEVSMYSRTIEALNLLNSVNLIPIAFGTDIHDSSIALLDYSVRADGAPSGKMSINFRYFFEREQYVIPTYRRVFTSMGFYDLDEVVMKSVDCLFQNIGSGILCPVNIFGFLVDRSSLLGAKAYLTNSINPGVDEMDNFPDKRLHNIMWAMVHLWKIVDLTRLDIVLKLLSEHSFKLAFYGINQDILSGISYKMYFRTKEKSNWMFDEIFLNLKETICDIRLQICDLYKMGYFVEILALLFVNGRINGLQFYFKKVD